MKTPNIILNFITQCFITDLDISPALYGAGAGSPAIIDLSVTIFYLLFEWHNPTLLFV